MDNLIIIAILVVIVIFALLHARKHFKGGGCCGSASNTIRSRKKLDAPKVGEKVLLVQGMHCENCQARVENAINRLDGVVCKVNLRKKTATVSYSTEVSDQTLIEIIEKLGYEATVVE